VFSLAVIYLNLRGKVRAVQNNSSSTPGLAAAAAAQVHIFQDFSKDEYYICRRN